MNTLDLEVFGEDERRIRKSNVRHIFTPHKPITDERFFRGRLEEMKQLLSTLNTPGEHALLYGDRGVGKSSLANIAAQNLVKVGSINSIFYFLHKAAEPFNCLEQDNLA